MQKCTQSDPPVYVLLQRDRYLIVAIDHANVPDHRGAISIVISWRQRHFSLEAAELGSLGVIFSSVRLTEVTGP